MFDVNRSAPAHEASPRAVTAADIDTWTADLLDVARDASDAERIDLLRALERLTCAAGGAQAVVADDFDTSQRAEQAAAGVKPDRQGRGVAAQIALARRESPHKGQQHLGLAKILTSEMPHTLSALRTGHITEWRATLLARETACLSREDRRTVDRALAGDPDALEAYGDMELVAAARKLAYKLDPESVVERRRKAESERRVTIRPAPDVMTHLSALLPVAQGVAVFAALTREAARMRALGDPRSKGQIMADTLVARVTQATSTEAGGSPVVPVAINLVMSDRTLLGGADDPAYVDGHGWVPSDLARALVLESLGAKAKTWLRRLYTRPTTGELIAMDATSRLFPTALAQLITIRDQRCRTPWCDAPIRHKDHVDAAEDGGPTSERNGQGLCEACNHAKQARGWTARPRPGPRHTVETVTPTGHRYISTAPEPPGHARRATRSRLEIGFAELLLAG